MKNKLAQLFIFLIERLPENFFMCRDVVYIPKESSKKNSSEKNQHYC